MNPVPDERRSAALEIIESYRTCEFTTLCRDGSPQTWPVSASLLSGGRFLLCTSIGMPQKVHNIRRNPKVSMLFSEPAGSGVAGSRRERFAVDSLELSQSVGLDPHGCDRVGTVRAFRTGKLVTAERITVLEQDRLFGYEYAFNPYMRQYRARIELSCLANGGTVIRWHGRYQTRWWLRPLFPLYLRRFMRSMATGLAVRAEQRHHQKLGAERDAGSTDTLESEL